MPAIFLIFLICFSSLSHAIQCYITAAKGKCWAHYDVHIEAINAANNGHLSSLNILGSMTWDRQKFPCQTQGATLNFVGKFDPVIWDDDQDRSYMAKSFKQVPELTYNPSSALEITICFNKDFSEVPIPPEFNGSCDCDFSVIPPVGP